MSARATPYPPAGFRVRIPASVWEAALNEVRRYGTLDCRGNSPGSEGLVYLGGIPAHSALIVTSLFRLEHEPQGDRVMPTLAEVRWLMTELRHRDEKLVAQMHSHRHCACHSPGDDEMATSFHDGFLSVVVPDFARNIRQIGQCIVHEYSAGTFRPLSTAETNSRFMIYSQIIDRRNHAEEPSQCRGFARRPKKTGRARLWRRRA